MTTSLPRLRFAPSRIKWLLHSTTGRLVLAAYAAFLASSVVNVALVFNVMPLPILRPEWVRMVPYSLLIAGLVIGLILSLRLLWRAMSPWWAAFLPSLGVICFFAGPAAILLAVAVGPRLGAIPAAIGNTCFALCFVLLVCSIPVNLLALALDPTPFG